MERRTSLISPVPAPFQASSEQVAGLIDGHPLAWVVTPDLEARLIPVRRCLDSSGQLAELSGHFPRSSGLVRSLGGEGLASFLFQGPAAYVSPSWFRQRQQAPTWASMSAAIVAEVRILDDPAVLKQSLSDLVLAMEAGRPDAWSIDELGERYEILARRIVPFRASVRSFRAAFRLCQDEDEETFEDLLAGLEAQGCRELARRMRLARGGAETVE